MAVRVLLVDDVDELRAVVRQALRLRGGFEVVAEASDGQGAIEAAGRHRPGVVVLDLGLPDLAGREVLTGLRDAAPDAQVVVYSGSATPAGSGLAGEVDGFVGKDQDIGYLVDLLESLGRRRHRSAAIELGPDHRDVAAARRFLADHCERWGCVDVIENARLVVSELVTNALVHAGTRCAVALQLVDRMLRIEVTDRGAGVPDLRDATNQDEHGRGLLMVALLSAAWGLEAVPGGKRVWAELPCEVEPTGEPTGPRTTGPSLAAPGPATPGSRARDRRDSRGHTPSGLAGRSIARHAPAPVGRQPVGSARRLTAVVDY